MKGALLLIACARLFRHAPAQSAHLIPSPEADLSPCVPDASQVPPTRWAIMLNESSPDEPCSLDCAMTAPLACAGTT